MTLVLVDHIFICDVDVEFSAQGLSEGGPPLAEAQRPHLGLGELINAARGCHGQLGESLVRTLTFTIQVARLCSLYSNGRVSPLAQFTPWSHARHEREWE